MNTAGCHRGAGRCSLITVLALVACKPPAPPTVNEPPPLPAEESCTGIDVAGRLPVPGRPPADPYALSTAAAMFATRGQVAAPVTMVCDLPDRIVALAATQGVEGGVRKLGGTAWVIARVATAPNIAAIAIKASSAGCKPGTPTCVWELESPAMPSIDTLPGQWLTTGGWVHGLDDMCRAVPDDAIAFCSTGTRMAYVELGCTPHEQAPVALQLGLHDASLERRYGLDVEVPVARLHGAVEPGSEGARWSYRFERTAAENGPYKTAVLTIDLGAPSAELVVDGAREACIAFGLYRRSTLAPMPVTHQPAPSGSQREPDRSFVVRS